MSADVARKRFSDVFWQASTLYKTDAALEGDFKFAALFGRTWRLFAIARLLNIQDQNAWGYVLNNAARGGHLETIKAIWSHAGFADVTTHDTTRGVLMHATGSCGKFAQHSYKVLSADELGDLSSGSLVKDWLNIALVNTAHNKHAECADYLHTLGADPAYSEYQAVQHALSNGDAPLAERLLAHTVFPIQIDIHDRLLEKALYSGEAKCVELILQRAKLFSVQTLEDCCLYAEISGNAQLKARLAAAYDAAAATTAVVAPASVVPKPGC